MAPKPRARAWVEPPLVQILVVVANIQMRTLKTELEKGSM